MKVLLRIIYSFVSIIAMLYILVMSLFGAGLLGFFGALAVLVVVAVTNTHYRKNKLEVQQSTQQLKKRRLFKNATVITVIVIGTIPIVGIGGFVVNCQLQARNAKKAFQPTLQKFETLYLSDAANVPKTIVETGGDCVDSQPYVHATKKQSIKLTYEEAKEKLEANFSKQGYEITAIKYYKSSCSTRADLSISDQNNSFRVSLMNEPADTYCSFSEKNATASEVAGTVMTSITARTH